MNIFFITLSTITFLFLLSGSLYYFKHNNRFIREKAVTISAVFMTIYSVYCTNKINIDNMWILTIYNRTFCNI